MDQQPPMISTAPPTPVTTTPVQQPAATPPPTTPQPTGPMQPPPPTDSTTPAQLPPRSPKKVVMIILAIVIVIALGVAAYFLLFSKPASVTTTTNPPLVKTAPTPTPDPTANWLTYTNPELGISLKYPETWTTKPYPIASKTLHGVVAVNDPALSSNTPLPATVSLVYINNPNQLSLQEFEEKNIVSFPNVYSSTSASLTVAGAPAYFTQDTVCPPVLCDQYSIAYKDKIYILTGYFNTKDDPNLPSERSVLEQIFSTVSFISPSTSPAQASISAQPIK